VEGLLVGANNEGLIVVGSLVGVNEGLAVVSSLVGASEQQLAVVGSLVREREGLAVVGLSCFQKGWWWGGGVAMINMSVVIGL
jgi:hypothetical protein